MPQNTDMTPNIKPRDVAVLDDSVKDDQDRLRKVIGKTKCDISLLIKGIEVLEVKGVEIRCQHPTTLREFWIEASYFKDP